MTEHYQKAIAWLQDREAEALLTSDLLQRFPEAAEHELPATIEWIIQQIEQAHDNWLRTSTDTAAMLEICGDVAKWFDKPADEQSARHQMDGIAAQLTDGEREKIGPDALQRMADVFDGPESER